MPIIKSIQQHWKPVTIFLLLVIAFLSLYPLPKLPEFQGEQGKRRLLIANDPDSGWIYVDIYDGDEKEAAGRYMHHVLTKAPFHIRRILAGNYNEFLSRFRLLDEALDDSSADSSKASSNEENSELINETSIKSKTE